MKNWAAEYSKGVEIVKNPDGTRGFTFPGKDGVHYVTREYSGKPTGFGLDITITKVSGNPVFKTTDGGTAALRLYFTNGDMGTENGRWWSNPAKLNLAIGRQAIVVTLNPANWSNVNGKSGKERPSEFSACVQKMFRCGFTFGGNFFGHGVYVTGGKASFTFKHKIL